MLFATYQPYCWKEISPGPDYCARYIGKDITYCFAADTIEDFIVGSMITTPTWPEQLIIFEAKHFHFIDKIEHYKTIEGVGRTCAKSIPIASSYQTVEELAKDGVEAPYQRFCDIYNSTFPKHKFEFIYPKNRIKPIKVVDVKRLEEALYDKYCDDDWRSWRQEFVDNCWEAWNKGETDHKIMERTKSKLEAQWCFQRYIDDCDIAVSANEIYDKNISLEIDDAVYWKLFKRVDNEITEQRLDKLVKYIKSSIKYED